MVTVNKLGTLGNNMWQYAVARIIAETNNLKLNCFSIPGFPNTNNIIDGDEYNNSVFTITGHYFDINNLPKNSKIELNGFFQRYEYICEHKEKIDKWFYLDVKPPIPVLSDDLVVSIRRGWNGYPVSLCPSQEFFLNVFTKIKFKRIILCTDSFEDSFFDFLKNIDVEVIKAEYSILEQFAIIKNANQIVLSPSTFCWWAAYLSNAEKIFYPWINDMIPTDLQLNWYPYNDKRYIKVEI